MSIEITYSYKKYVIVQILGESRLSCTGNGGQLIRYLSHQSQTNIVKIKYGIIGSKTRLLYFIKIEGRQNMAYTIGICDDNPEQLHLLRKYLDTYSQDTDQFSILESTEPVVFLNMLQASKPHLVFLDIDMGEMNGIQLGDRLKSLYPETAIVYVTAHEKYALEAFRVRAFHYLLKPLTREKFSWVFEEAVRSIKRINENKPVKTLTIQTKEEIICLAYSDIFYFEKVSHKIKVHTENRDIYYYDNFLNLIEAIDANCFIQCHQGYIANIGKIRGFRDKTLFLDGNLKLPVSRSYTERIKEMLAKRLFAGKEEL